MRVGWEVRALRAAVFAAVCVLLAALGHALMSDAALPWWALAAGAGITGTGAWWLAGRERGLSLVVAVTVASQAALHKAFTWAQATGAVPVPMHESGSGHTGHAMPGHSPVAHGDMAPSASMGSMARDMPDMSSTGMLAAHLLAALLSGLWLAHGERAAFRIAHAVVGWLAAPLRLPTALPVPRLRPRIRVRRTHAVRTPRRLRLAHQITSRGPPAEPAAA